MDFTEINANLSRIANSLDAMTPKMANIDELKNNDILTWNAEDQKLEAVTNPNFTDLSLLKSIDSPKETLLRNTQQFADGYSANNALLWGAKGMGKSSLVKSVFAHINKDLTDKITLIEISREDIHSLPLLISLLKDTHKQIILFCDDLSFEEQDSSYKSLKAILEGGLEGKPNNILLYATSNRRHLLSRDMDDNETQTSLRPKETADEKISLSDRFGLWLGFYNCNQNDYLAMIDGYIEEYDLKIERSLAHKEALNWSVTRGARSGRVASQYIADLAGRLKIKF